MGSRSTYVVGDVTDPRGVCTAIFEVLDRSIDSARIDAYSDYADQMPDDIRSAEAWLRDRGLRGAEPDPGESISIHRGEDVGWPVAMAYALWATRVTLRDSSGSTLATLDDGAHAVTVALTDQELGELTNRISAAATITPAFAI